MIKYLRLVPHSFAPLDICQLRLSNFVNKCRQECPTPLHVFSSGCVSEAIGIASIAGKGERTPLVNIPSGKFIKG